MSPRGAASSTNAGTWSRLGDLEAAGLSPGLVLTRLPVLALDLDHVLDGAKVATWARKLLSALPGAYVEVSPSGDGLHVLALAEDGSPSVHRDFKLPESGFPRAGLGFYCRAERYVTVTGRALGSSGQLDQLPTLWRKGADPERLVATLRGSEAPKAAAPPPPSPKNAGEPKDLPRGFLGRIFEPVESGGRSEQCAGAIRSLLGHGFSPEKVIDILERAWDHPLSEDGPLRHYGRKEAIASDVRRMASKPAPERPQVVCPGSSPAAEPGKPEAAPSAPPGYECTEGGTWRKADGDSPAARISPWPTWLVELTGVEGSGGVSGKFVQKQPHQTIEAVIPLSELTRGVSGAFLSRGMTMNPSSLLVAAWLAASMEFVQRQQGMSMVFSHCGWKPDGSFLLGNALYKDRTRTLRSPPEGVARDIAHFCEGGSEEAWKAAASTLLDGRNPAQAFALMSSFAAPLMSFLSREGGVVVSLISRSSGTGKSTALAAAKSVWGDMDGCAVGNQDTTNASFARIGFLHNLPAVCDDFDFGTDPRPLVSFLRCFTDGKERARLNAAGERTREPHRWSTVFLVGTNRSLEDRTLAVASGEAMSTRVLELPLSTRRPTTQTIRAFETNYGFAGTRFLRMLFDRGLDRVRNDLAEFELALLKAKQWSSEYRFHSRLLTCVAYAARLLNEQGYLAVDWREVLRYGVKQAEQSRDRASFQTEGIIGVLGRYMNENARRFVLAHDGKTVVFDGSPMPDAVLGRYEASTRTLYLARRNFQQWAIQDNASLVEMKDQMKEAGIGVGRARKVALTEGTRLPGLPVLCLALDLSKVEGLPIPDPPETENVVPFRTRGG